MGDSLSKTKEIKQVRYQKIEVVIWNDEKFINLSQEARYLFLYILTSPHSNALGIYVLPIAYICEDLKWSAKQLGKPFSELLSKEIILYDETTRLVFIKNHLRHNPLENENQTKAAIKIIKELPKSPLIKGLSEGLGKQFHKPLRELLQERLGEPYTKPVAVTEAVTETKEKEYDTQTQTAGLGTASVQAGLSKEEGSDKETPIVFNFRTKHLEGISPEDVPAWEKAYPQVNVPQELLRIAMWCESTLQKVKPRQGKGRKGLRRTITTWFSREQEKYTSSFNLQRSKKEAGGEFVGITYSDKRAYDQALGRGDKNIQYKQGENYV